MSDIDRRWDRLARTHKRRAPLRARVVLALSCTLLASIPVIVIHWLAVQKP